MEAKQDTLTQLNNIILVLPPKSKRPTPTRSIFSGKFISQKRTK